MGGFFVPSGSVQKLPAALWRCCGRLREAGVWLGRVSPSPWHSGSGGRCRWWWSHPGSSALSSDPGTVRGCHLSVWVLGGCAGCSPRPEPVCETPPLLLENQWKTTSYCWLRIGKSNPQQPGHGQDREGHRWVKKGDFERSDNVFVPGRAVLVHVTFSTSGTVAGRRLVRVRGPYAAFWWNVDLLTKQSSELLFSFVLHLPAWGRALGTTPVCFPPETSEPLGPGKAWSRYRKRRAATAVTAALLGRFR